MRTFEILNLATLLLTLIGFFVPRGKRPRWMAYLPSLAVLCVLIHLLFEGYRWQMVPAYVLTALLFLATVRGILPWREVPSKPARWRRVLTIIGAVLGLLVLIIAAAVPALFPVFRLPEPAGPYAVGARDLHFVDGSRPETFTPDPSDCREVFAQVWYPATLKGGEKPRSYMDADAARARAEFMSAPPFLLSYFSLVKTHSYPEAGFAHSGQPFPVLIFNHGFDGPTMGYTVLTEELASHGYVVVSVGHAYETPFFIGPDGQIKAFDPRNEEYQLRVKEGEIFLDHVAQAIRDRINSTRDLKEKEAIFRELFSRYPKYMESTRIWAADISFVIDELEKMNSGTSPFAGKLDLERIGVLGHSLGGAASGQLCVTDKRCMAGVNIDGLQFGDLLDSNLTQPFMFMGNYDATEATYIPPHTLINDLFYERVENTAYMILVKDSVHPSFTDLSLQGSQMSEAGRADVDGERVLEIQNAYSRAFFDKHLKGEEAPLLDGPSPDYPEVVLMTRHP